MEIVEPIRSVKKIDAHFYASFSTIRTRVLLNVIWVLTGTILMIFIGC